MTSDPSPTSMSDSALVDDVGFLLARASSVSAASSNAVLADFGLRTRSYAVLALACDGTRPSQRELATFLRLDPSQIVALVDDLERANLIVREPHPVDRRTKVVVATDKGRSIRQAAAAAIETDERRIHGGVDERERRRLTEMLRRWAFPVEPG